MTTTPKWKGYTLQELRIQRIVNETKIEILKSKVLQDGNKLKESSIPAPFASPLFKKVLGALDYADYAIMAFSIGRRVMKLIRHKRK